MTKETMEKVVEARAKVLVLDEKIKDANKRLQETEDVEEARSLGETLERLLVELQEAKDQLASVEAEDEEEQQPPQQGESEGRSFNPLATYSIRREGKNMEMNMEQRLGFANYVTRGVLTPEMRADAITNTTGVAAAIPENLLNQIIEQIDAVGMILPLVTRTSYPVGQSIAVDSAKPTASWVAEGASSDTIAKSNLGSIVFGAFKLRCEIRMTHEVTVQTIAAFESLFVKQVSEAMVKAIESKIVSADAGAANPTGILYRASGTDATVEVGAGEDNTLGYDTLCKAEAALPQQYEAGARWCMSKKTFMKFVGMVDSVGQPIARVNYGINGKPERVLLGRDVVLCPYLPDYADTVSADTTFAFLFDFSDYVLNTSYDLGISRKTDWDTEDHCVKAVMSVDGKVLDRSSLVKLVKKSA